LFFEFFQIRPSNARTRKLIEFNGHICDEKKTLSCAGVLSSQLRKNDSHSRIGYQCLADSSLGFSGLRPNEAPGSRKRRRDSFVKTNVRHCCQIAVHAAFAE
jgi:hypothetical protein